jgi:hypothetical protein
MNHWVAKQHDCCFNDFEYWINHLIKRRLTEKLNDMNLIKPLILMGTGLYASSSVAEPGELSFESLESPDVSLSVTNSHLNNAGSAGLNQVKPFPQGLYESGGPIQQAYDDAVSRAALIEGQDGILVRVAWNLCGNDMNCLVDTIRINLDAATNLNLKVALAVSDGHHIPDAVKNDCELFAFTFRDEPQTMCEVWDEDYLAHKNTLIQTLAQQFDDHPALAYVYFTAACATNGFEGHCRVDLNDYQTAGYTDQVFDAAYVAIMTQYLNEFVNTPVVFEAHAIFDRITMWESIWGLEHSSQKLGIALWWCAERLSLRGNDTVPVWALAQEIAAQTFSVCQTVGQFTEQPYRFTDLMLGPAFDYGTQLDWDQNDVSNAFQDTINWLSGREHHGQQASDIMPFAVLEAWTADLQNPTFAEPLSLVLDLIYTDGFE